VAYGEKDGGRLAARSITLGIAAVGPALAEVGDTRLCSSNCGTMVNGVCVLPALTVGQNARSSCSTAEGGVDTWTIAGGSFHWPAYECPGLPDPATAGTGDASVIFGDLKSARGWSTAEDDDSAARSAVHRPGSGRVLPRYRVGGDP
jgi:hypothetical protein